MLAIRNHRIDLWIVLDRENNPIRCTGSSAEGTWGWERPSSLFFFDNGGAQAEKIYVGLRQGGDSIISRVYDQKTYYDGNTEDLKRLLGEIVV